MSIKRIFPEAKIIAFVGLATGNMKPEAKNFIKF